MTGLNFDGASKRILEAAEHAVKAGGDHILDVSNEHVPLEHGTLRDSGKVTQDGPTATISYGTAYAVVEHERTDLKHDHGRTAKFLEKALTGEKGRVGQIIADHIRSEIGG